MLSGEEEALAPAGGLSTEAWLCFALFTQDVEDNIVVERSLNGEV